MSTEPKRPWRVLLGGILIGAAVQSGLGAFLAGYGGVPLAAGLLGTSAALAALAGMYLCLTARRHAGGA